MNSCVKNRKLIVWSSLDALDAGQAAQLEAHLLQCEICRAYRAEIADVSLIVSELSDAIPSADMARSGKRWMSGQLMLARLVGAGAESPVRPMAGWHWGLVVPAMAIVALSLLVLAILMREPVSRSGFAFQDQKQPPVRIHVTSGFLPTLANYRAVANQSFDQLDELLSQEAQKAIPAPPATSLAVLARLQSTD